MWLPNMGVWGIIYYGTIRCLLYEFCVILPSYIVSKYYAQLKVRGIIPIVTKVSPNDPNPSAPTPMPRILRVCFENVLIC